MAVSIDWATQVISVPQADLTFISGTLYALDTEWFRDQLKVLEAGEPGMTELDTHINNPPVTIAGTTFARQIIIINGYTVTFEDGQYAVRLDGSNNNIFEEGVINRNQVSIIPTNSAGLQRVNVPAEPTESHIEVAYDVSTTQIRINIWLDRLGVTVASPTDCRVDWYNPDGSLLFFETDAGPDTRGNFQINSTQALVANTAYYADVQVTDGTGTIITRRGVPTGP